MKNGATSLTPCRVATNLGFVKKKKKKENEKKKKSASRKYNKAKCYKMTYACTMEYYSALKVKDIHAM